MKKLSLLFLLMISALACLGQEFKGKVIGGFTFSQIDGDWAAGFNKPGFAGGFGVERDLAVENLSLQGELLYLQKGSRETQINFFIWRMNYVSVPVFLRWFFWDDLAFEAGAAADFLVSSRIDQGGGFIDNRRGLTSFNPTSVLGATIKAGDSWFFNLRHLYSLTTVDKLYRRYNHTFMFSVRYQLWGS